MRDGDGLRILAISRIFWPAPGGAAVMMRKLAETWVAQGHGVRVVATRSDPAFPATDRAGEVPVIRLPVLRARLAGTAHYIMTLSSWIRRHRREFDVACVSMLEHSAFAAVTAGQRVGLPVVLKTEGGGETGDVAWQEAALFGRRVRRRCRSADAVIAISPAIERELLAAGYPRRIIRRIPNAVTIPGVAWKPDDTARARRALDLESRPTMIYTGRLSPLKGLAELIRAVPHIEGRCGRVQLLLVGDGPERPRLERLAGETGVADRVRFVGHVPDVAPYLRAADLYVLPSHVEGMSVALLEALALGMPAAASDIEANRGLVPERHLTLFAVGNSESLAAAVAPLLASQPAADDAVRELVRERYSADAVGRQYVELFRELGQERP